MIYKVEHTMLRQEKKAALILLLLAFISIALALTLSRESEASSWFGSSSGCSCTFTGRKDYSKFQESKTWHLFGTVRHVERAWSCEYSCALPSGGKPVKVIGTYEMSNDGDDTGLEGICEGTVYESEYNPYKGDFIYMYKRTDSFDPARADAVELASWARSYCR